MDAYDIYGMNFEIDFAKNILEQYLSLRFEKRDSAYFGGYFIAGVREGENFEIKKNIDLIDGEPLESKFHNYSVLIFVNCTKRSDEICDLLREAGIERLSHNVYD